MSAWLGRAVCWLALGKLLAGLAGCLSLESIDVARAVQLGAYGAVGLMLWNGAGRDQRARDFGATLLLLGSTFADTAVGRLRLPGPVTTALMAPALEFASAGFLWLFVRRFPRRAPSEPAGRVAGRMSSLSFALAVTFTATNILLLDSGITSTIDALRWGLFGVLLVSPFPYAWARARHAPAGERLRTQLFLAGVAACLVPAGVALVAFWGLSSSSPEQWERIQGAVALAVQACLFALPLTTAYAIRVHQVLEVRFVLRRALQYAFARYTLLAVATLPFAALLAHVYAARERSVNDLVREPAFLWLALAVGLAGALIATRRRVFAALDRRFFREEYDAQRILSALVDKSRRAGSARELAEVINRELDAALHLESVAAYGRDPLSGHFRAPGAGLPALAPGAALAVLLGGSPEPLDVDLEDARSPLRRLPEAEKQWLADLGTVLLVPLLGSEGTLIGFLSLGPKKSELPFSRGDRELLGAVAAAGALTLENRLSRDSAGRRSPDGAPTPTAPGTLSPSLSLAGDEQVSDESAAECPRCGLLALPGTPACPRCGGEPRRAALPLVLLGKYAVERRIGAGGMGVVYKAVDLALGRAVAIKTLPRIAPEQAMRLRREARAMVAVSHPNLALIFGAETWHGTPALVCEYLEGGTLADRLRHGPLPALQVVQLGLAMSGVLERIHAAGILHRDVKPSNIGYAGDGTPKLLDFGLARIMEDTRREGSSDGGSGESDTASVLHATGSSVIAGTPAYVSPEVVVGQRPTPAADLWALAVTLYEALTGTNPLARDSLQETVAAVRDAEVPRLREARPDLPAGLASLLDAALAAPPRLRPQSARELHVSLAGL